MDFSNVQTRNGKKVRILCTDRAGAYPVVGLVDNKQIATWTIAGKQDFPEYDLYEIPKVECRPFNASELTGLMGQTVVTKDGRNPFLIVSVRFGKINRIFTNEHSYTSETLLESCEFLDGSPCGVTE